MFEVFGDVMKGKYERNSVTKSEPVTSKAALEKIAGPLEIRGRKNEWGYTTGKPRLVFTLIYSLTVSYSKCHIISNTLFHTYFAKILLFMHFLCPPPPHSPRPPFEEW